ncbi:hypothetical protein LTR53_004233 [Teratosphaeriaceae sp. CCFEE 6253]|nr:hypothetical protein LTR53_004233 [Teratosphaeriaceae sp. CCFEE 6253]
MANPTRPPANPLVAAIRKLYNPLGFSKGYNFVLWFITMGYLFGFSLARLQYLSFHGVFCNPANRGATGAAPGECYYYLRNPYKIGMMLHLFTILPAGLLVVLQFVPIIRHKALLFHRLNGYAVILLSLVSSAGVLIILPHAFGGDFAAQTWGGAMVLSTTLAYLLAYVNIKLLQIEQHRAWMLRAWAYFSTIVTIRMIQFSAGAIISLLGTWHVQRPCAQINSIWGPHNTLRAYPGCAAYYDGTEPDQRVVVTAGFPNGSPVEISAALGLTFGAAGWVAWWLHAIMIEVYLRLTPAESERLRQVSYERQLARGCTRPGYAGLVAERFGDAHPYVPLARSMASSGCGEYVEMVPKAAGQPDAEAASF